jgi:hypothetical protein
MYGYSINEQLVSALSTDRDTARSAAIRWFHRAPHTDVLAEQYDTETIVWTRGFTVVFEQTGTGHERRGTARLDFVHEGKQYLLDDLTVPLEPVRHAVETGQAVGSPA